MIVLGGSFLELRKIVSVAFKGKCLSISSFIGSKGSKPKADLYAF
mgnify:CR=1 FL=1